MPDNKFFSIEDWKKVSSEWYSLMFQLVERKDSMHPKYSFIESDRGKEVAKHGC